jgi:hypothetical protein
MHYAVAGLGFLAFIVACFVFAGRFIAFGQRSLAAFSLATGALFLVSWLGVASGKGNAVLNVALSVAIALAFGWIAGVAAHLMRDSR